MRRLASIVVATASLFIPSARSGGQQNSAAAWLSIVVSAPVGPTLGIEVAVRARAEHFLNDTCRPSGLEGIQLLSVQTGHDEVFHLHIYCRQDMAASADYKVSMISVPDHKVDATTKAVLAKPNLHIGPLFLGATGEPDAIVLIEKAQ